MKKLNLWKIIGIIVIVLAIIIVAVKFAKSDPIPIGISGVSFITRGWGFNLTGQSITRTGTLDLNTSVVQQRVTGTCTGQFMTAISIDGTVTCASASSGSGSFTPDYIYLWTNITTNVTYLNESKLNLTVNALITLHNASTKAYVDAQDVITNTSMKTYVDTTFTSITNFMNSTIIRSQNTSWIIANQAYGVNVTTQHLNTSGSDVNVSGTYSTLVLTIPKLSTYLTNGTDARIANLNVTSVLYIGRGNITWNGTHLCMMNC